VSIGKQMSIGAFPSPLWGGVRGRGREVTRLRRLALPSMYVPSLPTPLPTLPHKGGGIIRRPAIGLLFSLSVAAVALHAGDAPAQMPAAIAAADAAPVVTLHAEGAQIYECKTADDGKLAWAFREPIATLILGGKTVGRHYAGPNWEHMDGSIVQGKVAGNAPGATTNDIAWLKLDVVGHRGNSTGTFASVDIVQRINTSGGVLRGPCEQAGALRSAPYSADYVFLHKGG
jgi:hypothetical protein